MTLRLYDLAGAEPDRRFSPYCWRTRMALAHKQLAYETIPWRFTEKGAIASSGQKLVPVMVDGDHWIADSWIIANHLEDTYRATPRSLGIPGRERSHGTIRISPMGWSVRSFRSLRWTFWTTSPNQIEPTFGRAGKSASACRLRPLLPITSVPTFVGR
jgi:glutathione S-transferase